MSAMCPEPNSRYKRAQWGPNATNGFLAADETAYPMGLARLITVVFTHVLFRCGIYPLPDTLEQLQPRLLQKSPQMRASVESHARSSKIPQPLRTYNQCFRIRGPRSILPNFSVLLDALLIQQPQQWLLQGSRLLEIERVSLSHQRGTEHRGNWPRSSS